MCDMTHPYVCHVTFACVTWLINTYDMALSKFAHAARYWCLWCWCLQDVDVFDDIVCALCVFAMSHDSLHMRGCDMTHSYVWHDSFAFLTWFIHMYAMTHPYVSHASCLNSRRWILMSCMCDAHVTHTLSHTCCMLMTLACVCHVRFICVTWLAFGWGILLDTLVHVCDMSVMFMCVTWLINQDSSIHLTWLIHMCHAFI